MRKCVDCNFSPELNLTLSAKKLGEELWIVGVSVKGWMTVRGLAGVGEEGDGQNGSRAGRVYVGNCH